MPICTHPVVTLCHVCGCSEPARRTNRCPPTAYAVTGKWKNGPQLCAPRDDIGPSLTWLATGGLRRSDEWSGTGLRATGSDAIWGASRMLNLVPRLDRMTLLPFSFRSQSTSVDAASTSHTPAPTRPAHDHSGWALCNQQREYRRARTDGVPVMTRVLFSWLSAG